MATLDLARRFGDFKGCAAAGDDHAFPLKRSIALPSDKGGRPAGVEKGLTTTGDSERHALECTVRSIYSISTQKCQQRCCACCAVKTVFVNDCIHRVAVEKKVRVKEARRVFRGVFGRRVRVSTTSYARPYSTAP